MCVIIAKDKNDRLPTKSELYNCYRYNPDGAGFMYTLNNRVIIDKGYMTYKEFEKRYNYLLRRFDNFKNKALVIHCRIGTAGSNTPQNTHPYPITSDINKLHSTYIRSKIGIAHNGIISEYNPSIGDNRDINDTQNFIATYLTALYKGYKTFYKNDDILDAIDYLTGSKFAILDKDDNLATIGHFITEDGLKFSNSSYETRYYTYYNHCDTFEWDDSQTTATDDDCELIEHKTSSDIFNTYDIPSKYFIEYDNEILSGYNYCIDDDGRLYKYTFLTDTFDYITNDFTIYNEEFEPVNLEELICY